MRTFDLKCGAKYAVHVLKACAKCYRNNKVSPNKNTDNIALRAMLAVFVWETFVFLHLHPPGNIISMGFVISVGPNNISRLDKFLYAINIKRISRRRKGTSMVWDELKTSFVRQQCVCVHWIEGDIVRRRYQKSRHVIFRPKRYHESHVVDIACGA